jgi:hypothetical protein
MTDPQQVNDEFGRRLAAARGYGRAQSAEQWAKEVMDIDRGTLRRYELGKIDPSKRSWAIESCMVATGLPREFFVIDFKDLPEMVAAWQRVQAQADTPRDFVESQERDEEEHLPPEPNGSQSEGPEPGAESR